MDDSGTFDDPFFLDPVEFPPPSAALPAGLSGRPDVLLELFASERAYASDLALIRDVHLPVALGTCSIFLFHSRSLSHTAPRQ